MTLSIKNHAYAILIWLDLMFPMSLWKEFQLLKVLNNLSIRHLIKLILYENDVKLDVKIEEKSCIVPIAICLKCEILITDTWNEYINESDGMINLLFNRKFNVRMLIV